MTFWPEDDHMLLMNLNPYMNSKHGACQSVTGDGLKQLRDVGIRTVMQYAHWDGLVRDGWGYLDTLIAQARQAGMRSIINTYHAAPKNLPASYYSRQADGKTGIHHYDMHILSLWNLEARARLIGHIGELANRYGPDASVIFTGIGCGETVMFGHGFYDEAALQSHREQVGGRPDESSPETKAWVRRGVVDFYMAFNEALLPQHNQTWNPIHRALITDGHRLSGMEAQDDICAAEYERWPDADRYLLQYTYWHHIKNGYKPVIADLCAKNKMKLVVEAGYCSGLPRTAPMAIEAGMRGQIVSPIHPETHTDRLEQKNIDAIATAIRLWEQADTKRRAT